jgi:hypothetical protein
LQACSTNISAISFDANFDNWDQQHQYQFNSALNLESNHFENRDSDEEEEEEEEENDEDQNDPFKTSDPFADAAVHNPSATSGFDAIIGNNNISSNHLLYGYLDDTVYDHSNDFLMNFYASQCTNYPFTATCITTNTPSLPPPLSSYNPFHHNNNNNSSPDNFADFDTHFASMTRVDVAMSVENDDDVTTPTNPAPSTIAFDSNEEQATQCFVATTQVIEISSVPPTSFDQEPEQTHEAEEESTKREFHIGPNVNASIAIDSIIQKTIPTLDELEDEEFFSLRDDSNEMSSLTDDTDRKFINNENTEIPDDDDDDFASADER